MNLNEGEVICKKCEGEGFTRFTEMRGKHFYPMKMVCDKCGGDGKLDWVEDITGKKELPAFLIKPDNKTYLMSWGSIRDDEGEILKSSSEEIKEQVNPGYRKRLERKIAYNLSR